ncbi:MAG: hypothetical protein RSP_04820 [Rhodanobacter sp.]
MKIHPPIRAALALTITAALAVTSGCATIDNATQSMGHAVGIKNDNAAAGVTGGALGCGVGALASHFLGKSALAGCALGGAAGALSAIQIHRHQVDEARKLAAEAEAAGAKATVNTKTVDVADNDGQKKPEPVLSSLDIALQPADVASHGTNTAGLLVKAAHLADASADPVTITLEGPKVERDWMRSQVQAALKAGTKTTVRVVPAQEPQLILAPVPDVG